MSEHEIKYSNKCDEKKILQMENQYKQKLQEIETTVKDKISK